jgi:predicted DNA-binding protein (MmcQ/YjbR family)
MDIEQIREFCLSFNATSESFPFDDSTLVFKVGSKMFCLVSLESPFSMNLKCEPERAIELREQYHFVVPGFHMNKKHWNTINNLEQVPPLLLREMITNSYDLVSRSLTRKERESLGL